jgi:hypothetical protein
MRQSYPETGFSKGFTCGNLKKKKKKKKTYQNVKTDIRIFLQKCIIVFWGLF